MNILQINNLYKWLCNVLPLGEAGFDNYSYELDTYLSAAEEALNDNGSYSLNGSQISLAELNCMFNV